MKKAVLTKACYLPEKKHIRLLLATFCLTLGVYFSFPERGFAATFPLMFLFSFVAGFFDCPILFFPLVGGAIALFYGVMASFSDPFSFAVVSALLALCGAFGARAILRLKAKRKIVMGLGFVLVLAIGTLLPLFFVGTPIAYRQEKQKAEEYLSEHYPDQTFGDMIFYYDFRQKKYCATVSYDNEGNTLTSSLRFGEHVEDGFFSDYSRYVLMKRKTDLIEVFHQKEFSLITEEVELLVDRDQPVPGHYGTVSETLYPFTHFSVTFRDEKPDREEFADACRLVLLALREGGVEFGKITFYGLDVGNVLYRCEVTGDMNPEEILSQVKYQR